MKLNLVILKLMVTQSIIYPERPSINNLEWSCKMLGYSQVPFMITSDTVTQVQVKQRLKKKAKLANIDHFIESLPGGYDHVLSDESGISQGQRQLLTIARAMVTEHTDVNP